MYKITQKLILGFNATLLLLVGTFGYTLITSEVVYAAPCAGGSGALPDTIFVPWYKYLECDASGAPVIDEWGQAIPLVGMAVIEMITRLAGLIAVGFIIWGGIQYTTSQGEPEGINNAKSTLLNAVIGLIIVFIAVGLVQFVAGLIR